MVSTTFTISTTTSTCTTTQIPQHDDRPSSSIGLYDLGVRFGTYRNAMPYVETSMEDIPLFQTPHASGFLSKEVVEKDLLDCFSM
jgi:hypothetical protein